MFFLSVNSIITVNMHFTNYAIVVFTKQIYESMNNYNISIGLFLYLLVNHNIFYWNIRQCRNKGHCRQMANITTFQLCTADRNKHKLNWQAWGSSILIQNVTKLKSSTFNLLTFPLQLCWLILTDGCFTQHRTSWAVLETECCLC